jgi:adenosylcobinamide kinase / adenosylcobinamide-phosphate guanylyltransferase
MAKIILTTGGSRSGKSAYAQKLAESFPGSRAFIATCPVLDDEMRDRIRRHQEARCGNGWDTIEEALDIRGVIDRAHRYSTLVVDCLTLWINNLLYEARKGGRSISEGEIALICKSLIEACEKHPGIIIFVTNEIGMGIIPENPLSRRYRDLVGRCNQLIAEASARTVLLISGQALEIKKEML